MIALYVIATGNMYIDDKLIATGYAGLRDAANDFRRTHEKNVGPLPCGSYTMLPARKHPRLGPTAIPLQPSATNEMHGRSGFYIHGDNKAGDRSASQGCIVLPSSARKTLAALPLWTPIIVIAR